MNTPPKPDQRIRVGEDSGVVIHVKPHPKFGHFVLVRWDSGREGCFFTATSKWQTLGDQL